MNFGSIAMRREDRVGIDLGTANTIAVMGDAGIVFDQPTVCCFQAYDAVTGPHRVVRVEY